MSEYTPVAVFRPQSGDDVSSFFSIVRKHNVQFAIRGGGQQPLEACSNIDDGITLDLTTLDSIEAKPNDHMVSVGAGAKWAAIYEKVESAGLGVGGSRSGKGGVGGLALSGGLSFFSTREGFISDNVVNSQVTSSTLSLKKIQISRRH
jgi:FAD/FMN-containing dehydrogenase